MKSQRKKLLKILSITGIFVATAAVPITLLSKYVISASLTNSKNQNNQDNNNQDGGGDTTPQAQTIVPKLKSSINLSGSLDKIFDAKNSSSSNTNSLIAQEIKNNLDKSFDNASDLEKVNNLSISVDGGFSGGVTWGNKQYDQNIGWGKETVGNEILYGSSLDQFNISSLDDFKSQLNNDTKLKDIISKSDASKFDSTATYSIASGSNLGLVGDNLVHVNVIETDASSNTKSIDLQIPISNINLNVSNMIVSVSGDNVETQTNKTTNFSYNVGISDQSQFTNPVDAPVASASEVKSANKILVKLGYAEVAANNQITLNQDLLKEELGIYNVTFSNANASIAPNGSTTDGTTGSYKISLDATPTPNKDFVWEDGTSDTKPVSFNVNVSVDEITPSLNSTLDLKGSLSRIFDTSGSGTRKDTNTVIAEDIKSNLNNYFSNGNDLKTVEDLDVTVNGNFPTSTWTGVAYDTWKSSTSYTGIYSSESAQIDITSLNDLKTKLTTKGLYGILLAAGLKFSGSSFAIQNEIGLSGGDLLHVNIRITSEWTTNPFTVDLAIPVSDINLKVSNLGVSVSGSNVKALSNGSVNYTYNVGIDDTVNFVKPTTGVTALSSANKTNVNEALVSLGFATKSGTNYTLNKDKISAALGVFNCTFEGISIQEDASTANNFTITLKATPNTNYYWEDGTNVPKELSFKVDLTVS
ncbi:hypothetical protein D8X55_04470 [Malacoplasma penetrans]|uniref:Signal-peptide-less P35 lipoprotein homolog n=1 Tax=Malacoplasma penetrans (strain HF-2) TaxID=272633 RepID=Q8EV66_MALP2|nr:P35 family lipoprotein [Malacoplasma penetrans]RXY96191.1 hypothetical protein D8X55_04470 [Malacoplasma penetrans]BAC44494.1 signal-peptide-less P35 lipoprotein homolog [Malacoplasma penetrans HF-2]